MWPVILPLLLPPVLAATECSDAHGKCDVETEESGLYQMGVHNHKVLRGTSRATMMHEMIETAFSSLTGTGSYFDPTRSEVIDEAFAGVNGYGGFATSNIFQDVTWEQCTNINWTKVREADPEAKRKVGGVEAMLRELHVDKCYNEEDTEFYNDATCQALRILVATSIDMEGRFPTGPVFANYSVVSWGRFPSWVKGSVSGLDYTKPLPISARLNDPNGVLGYGLCSIIRTVLTQSVNQESTGTCSYVASLAAISRKAPAIALKVGMRLLWTGMISEKMGPACPLIYDQQPGLVPFLSDAGWKPSFFGGASQAACTGNPIDCLSAQNRPSQNVGITWMWTQALISNWMKLNYGGCDDERARSELTYPGQPAEEAKIATRNQGGWFNSMMWSCDETFDPKDGTCKLYINENVCFGIAYDTCVQKLRREPPPDVQRETLKPLFVKYKGQAFAKGIVERSEIDAYITPRIRDGLSGSPRVLDYYNWLIQESANIGVPVEVLEAVEGPNFPSFTEELLRTTCDSFVNMLIIDATVLSFVMRAPSLAEDLKRRGLPFYGNVYQSNGQALAKSNGCNHAVYLEKCDWDANEFTIWTWGTTVKLTKEFILGWPTNQPHGGHTSGQYTWNTGTVCGSITADKITVS